MSGFPKVLLLGSNGQVGFELAQSLLPVGEVVALGRADADFSNPESLRAVVRSTQPAIIVNAAAYTAVDRAESESELAQTINATATGVLAEEAEKLSAVLVHYSTDYVFDGEKNEPYVETDPTNPLGVYGRTKLEGERLVLARCKRHLIFRTSWVYATRGRNFVKTMLKLGRERKELRIVADQIGAPTSARLIADVTAHALRQVAARNSTFDAWGVCHLTPVGETSWHGFAQAVFGQYRKQGGDDLVVENVVPIPAAEYPTPAKRPMSSRLNTDRLRKVFDLRLPDWRESLSAMHLA